MTCGEKHFRDKINARFGRNVTIGRGRGPHAAAERAPSLPFLWALRARLHHAFVLRQPVDDRGRCREVRQLLGRDQCRRVPRDHRPRHWAGKRRGVHRPRHTGRERGAGKDCRPIGLEPGVHSHPSQFRRGVLQLLWRAGALRDGPHVWRSLRRASSQRGPEVGRAAPAPKWPLPATLHERGPAPHPRDDPRLRRADAKRLLLRLSGGNQPHPGIWRQLQASSRGLQGQPAVLHRNVKRVSRPIRELYSA